MHKLFSAGSFFFFNTSVSQCEFIFLLTAFILKHSLEENTNKLLLTNYFKISNSISRITEKTENVLVYSPTESSFSCTFAVWTSGKRVRMNMIRVWDWHIVPRLSLLHKQVRNSWRSEWTGYGKMQKCFSAHFLQKCLRDDLKRAVLTRTQILTVLSQTW